MLHKDIKSLILSGILKEDDYLPSENELCEKYQITRSTVRKALDLLVSEGYIVKKHGKGSMVSLKRNSLGILSFRGFSDVLGNNTRKIFSVLLQDPVLIHWPKNFFYNLSEEESAVKTYFISRLRFVDDDPVMLEYTYLPNIKLDNFLTRQLVNNSLFQTLRNRYHIEVNNLSQDLRAIPADDDVAELLNYYPGSPLVHIYRKYRTSRPGLNIYSSLYCNTEKYYLSNDFE
ncbi:MAG: GntR family transcriptional regulator [Bacteroidales bacterium]|nr:GntR family transcriptional regulator [Bacteroidales bacterium]